MRRPGGRGQPPTLRSLQREIEGLLKRCPKDSNWGERGDVLFTIGMAYAEFGREGFERACDHLLRAVEVEERAERAPIEAIQQLANMEVRRGDGSGDGLVIQRGGERLRLLASAVAAQPGDPGSQPTAERCALIGSAWKRRAASLAREGKAFDAELASSRDWYARGMGMPGTRKFNAYCALNRVMLDALLEATGDVDLARKAAAAARERFLASRDYWDAIMPADARLAEALCSGMLEDLAKAETEIATVLDTYGAARAAVVENTKNWDSVVDQVELLAVFAAARDRAVLADSLKAIAARLRPNGGNGGAGKSAPAAPGATRASGSKRTAPKKARKTKTSRS